MKIIPWRRQELPAPLGLDLDQLWNRFWDGEGGWLQNRLPEVFQARRFPPINVSETEEAFEITLDLPGLEEKDIEVEMMGNQLLVSGERKWEDEKKGKEFHRVETQYGRFERAIPLPEGTRLQPDEIEAKYKKGVLHIQVPKIEKTPAKKIAVQAG